MKLLGVWLVQCGMLTSLCTRRVKIYSTATIAVSVNAFGGEALLLCLGSSRTGSGSQAPVPAATNCLAKTHPESRSNYGTLVLLGQGPVKPTKLASLWSEPAG